MPTDAGSGDGTRHCRVCQLQRLHHCCIVRVFSNSNGICSYVCICICVCVCLHLFAFGAMYVIVNFYLPVVAVALALTASYNDVVCSRTQAQTPHHPACKAKARAQHSRCSDLQSGASIDRSIECVSICTNHCDFGCVCLCLCLCLCHCHCHCHCQCQY